MVGRLTIFPLRFLCLHLCHGLLVGPFLGGVKRGPQAESHLELLEEGDAYQFLVLSRQVQSSLPFLSPSMKLATRSAGRLTLFVIEK
jgi:hypothetical protein